MLAFRYPDAHELHTTLMLGQDRVMDGQAVDLTKNDVLSRGQPEKLEKSKLKLMKARGSDAAFRSFP